MSRFLLLILLIVIISAASYGQTELQLSTVVRLPSSTIRLDSLLAQVSTQCGVSFSYNSKKIAANQKIKLSSNKLKMREILDQLKTNYTLSSAFIGDHMILASANVKPMKRKEQIVSPSPAKDNMVDSKEPITEQEQKDTLTITSWPTIKTRPDVKNDFIPVTKAKPEVKIVSSATKKVKKKNRFAESPLIAAGILSTDEILYAGAGFWLGWKNVYGIATINTNFRYNQLRYGIGYTLKVNDRKKIHVQLSAGKSAMAFDQTIVDIDYQHTIYKIPHTGKATLYRFTALYEYKMLPNLSLTAGPVVNRLSAKYDTKGDGHFPRGIPDKQDPFRPPYSLMEVTAGGQEIRTWIGLQAGIKFKIGMR